MIQPLRRTFPGRHDQVARARDFVRKAACCCPILDEAVLLTSELCTNALQHTASANGGAFEVTIYRGHDCLRVEVHDDGAKTEPAIQAIEGMQEDGRGLEIVAMIAHRWGQCGGEYGRTVFFELRWNPHDDLSGRSSTRGCPIGRIPGRSLRPEIATVSDIVSVEPACQPGESPPMPDVPG